MRTRFLVFGVCAAVVWAVVCASGGCAQVARSRGCVGPAKSDQRPWPIRVETVERTLADGTMARGLAAFVALDDPRLTFFVSSPSPRREGDPEGTETHLQTTQIFFEEHKADLAINANFFGGFDNPPKGWRADQPVNIIGPALDDAGVRSPLEGPGALPNGTMPVLTLRRVGQGWTARVACDGPADIADAGVAVAGVASREGGCLVLLDSANVANNAAVAPNARHPRTGAGVSADGRTLVLVAMDGRLPGWSVGLTLPELADLMKDLGADDALNLDGGGSTALFASDATGVLRTNRPSEGNWRAVAVNLGVRVAR